MLHRNKELRLPLKHLVKEDWEGMWSQIFHPSSVLWGVTIFNSCRAHKHLWGIWEWAKMFHEAEAMDLSRELLLSPCCPCEKWEVKNLEGSNSAVPHGKDTRNSFPLRTTQLFSMEKILVSCIFSQTQRENSFYLHTAWRPSHLGK